MRERFVPRFESTIPPSPCPPAPGNLRAGQNADARGPVQASMRDWAEFPAQLAQSFTDGTGWEGLHFYAEKLREKVRQRTGKRELGLNLVTQQLMLQEEK